jgi:hypothetical protein
MEKDKFDSWEAQINIAKIEGEYAWVSSKESHKIREKLGKYKSKWKWKK